MARKLFHLFMLVALPTLVLGGFAQAQAEPYKLAIVMPGVITDKSFNQTCYEAIMQAKEKLGIEVAYSEKVPQPDQAEALADYARRGYNLVIGAGGEFQDAVDRVAKRYPETMFLVLNGVTAYENVAIARFHYEALAYALGHIAGRMTESGTVAFIGGQQIAFSMQLLEGYTNGFNKARPDGKMLVAWTNDWDDISKGKEAALSVISQGADMVFPTMDNAIVGSFQGAKEQHKWAFGIYFDAYGDWPDTILQSAIMKWGPALMEIVTIAKDGNLEGKEYLVGLNSPDAASLGTYNPAIPEAVKAEVEQILADLKSGKIDPTVK